MKIKYAIFTFLMLGMMTTVFAQTQKYQYPDANGPQGISVVSRSANQMVLNFSVEEISVSSSRPGVRLVAIHGKAPQIDPTAFVAPAATGGARQCAGA